MSKSYSAKKDNSKSIAGKSRTKKNSRRYNSILNTSRSLSVSKPSLKSIKSFKKDYSESIIPNVQFKNYMDRLSVYPQTKQKGSFDDYQVIYLSTHAQYPDFNVTCSDVDIDSKYPEFTYTVVDDMLFQIPENVLIIDPTNHGGVSWTNPKYDNYVEFASFGHLDDLIRNKMPGQQKHHKYVSQYLKIYETGSYFINLHIEFEKTNPGKFGDQMWGVFEQPDKEQWTQESCALSRTVRRLRIKPDKEAGCTSLRHIVQYYQRLNPGKKIAFVVTSCRVYPPFNNYFDNLKEVYEDLKEVEKPSKYNLRKIINNYFHVFMYLLIIPVIQTNGYIMADKYYDKANPRNLFIKDKSIYNEFFSEYDNSGDVEEGLDNYEDNIDIYNKLKDIFYKGKNLKEQKSSSFFMELLRNVQDFINKRFF